MNTYEKEAKIPIRIIIPIRVIRNKKPSTMDYLRAGLKIINCLFLAGLLIISQAQLLTAFEAHVINVVAEIDNDIPTIDPPGGQFCDDEEVIVELSVSLAGASIYYTLDGFDPICGQNGTEYTGPFALTQGATVKARSCHNDQQSAIAIWYFDISPEYCPLDECLKINEVYYDPDDDHQGPPNEEKFEWIELYNSCQVTINLQNWYFEDDAGEPGREIIHQNYVIDPGVYVIIAANAAVWNNYWTIIPDNAVKIALGGNMMFNSLNDSQDHIKLYDSQGTEIDCVAWNDYGVFLVPGPNPCSFPDGWVSDVDEGHSIARISPGFDTDRADDWEDLASPNPGSNPHSIGFDDDNFVELTPEEGGPIIEEIITEIEQEIETALPALEIASSTEEVVEEMIEEVTIEATTIEEVVIEELGVQVDSQEEDSSEGVEDSEPIKETGPVDESETTEPEESAIDLDKEAKLEEAAILEEDSITEDDLLDD